jgi:hypothetical protein
MSPEATASAMAERLDALAADTAAAALHAVAGPEAAVERAARWLAEGPSDPWDTPAHPVEHAGRKALLRALRPYLERRGEFDAALVQADEEAVARLDRLERAVRASEQAIRRRLDDAERRMDGLDDTAMLLERLRRRLGDAEATLAAVATAAQQRSVGKDEPRGGSV